MAHHYFMLTIFTVAGIISLLASVLNWNWFFTAHNADYLVRRVGRLGARLFYGTIGLLLIVAAIYFYNNIPH